MSNFVFERIEHDSDPNRCQGRMRKNTEQCYFKKIPGTQYCPRHAANATLQGLQKEARQLYHLTRWKDKMNAKADHPELKSLREELGILRMVLEERINQCQDENELLMRAGAITEMVREITKTARMCHALELSVGSVLDKQQALIWVTEIGETLSRYIKDPDVLEMISEDILISLERHTGVEKDGQQIYQAQAQLV